MKNYSRLALLLIVLTLGVAMLSTAINILGDITDLDLEQTIAAEGPGMSNPGGLRKDEEKVEVGESGAGKKGPILQILLPTETKYLRRFPAENYTDGFWVRDREYETINYTGQTLRLNVTGLQTLGNPQFQVIPQVSLYGDVVVAKNTIHMEFNGSLVYAPDAQVFYYEYDYEDSYWVTYRKYGYTDANLLSDQPVSTPENLQIPDTLKVHLSELAEEITEGKDTPIEKYRAIEQYLIDEYEWDKNYTASPSNIDPVRWFLFNDRRGVGSHFNSAFILLSRSIGLPARAVVGYNVDPWADNQYVLPQQAYLWAEVEFEDAGLVTFDAGPIHKMKGEGNPDKLKTYTNITGNDPIAIKGKQFNVWGTVELFNGSAVDGAQVEVILKHEKYNANETGLIVGVDFVENGKFNVTCDAAPELQVGNYSLIAHTLKNRLYRESFSDPAIKVVAETEVRLNGPRQVYRGRNVTYTGILLDASNLDLLVNQTMLFEVNGETIPVTCNEDGYVEYQTSFPRNGKTNITLRMPGAEFYLASESSFTVNVLIPPPSTSKIISLLFGFPQNLIWALTAATGIGVMAARRSRRLKEEEPTEARVKLPRRRLLIGYEDNIPLEYRSYEEGVVKLFNRFYVSMQRKYPQIEDTMTPREFEATLVDRIPANSHPLLGDLVTSYEIAMYSNLKVTQEDFKQSNATIELIIELMKNAQ